MKKEPPNTRTLSPPLKPGDETNAGNLLKRMIEKYAHSDQAQLAKKKLEGVK